MDVMRTLMILSGLFASLTCAACGGNAAPSGGSPLAPTPVPGGTTAGTGTTGDPAPAPAPTPAPTTARYVVVFDAAWRVETHPTDFPSNPHFSPLVGGTHDASVRFWDVGAVATDGIRRMAEQGATSPLDQEIAGAVSQNRAQHVFIGGGVPLSPGSVSLEFDISQSHPLVTLVTMVAPSPDWFTGVSGLALFEGGRWVDERRVDLYPHDAGTDGGTTYDAPDLPLASRLPITRIEGRPFALGGRVAPVGSYTFRRLN